MAGPQFSRDIHHDEVVSSFNDTPLSPRDPSLHFGLNAPPTASQTFVPGGGAHVATQEVNSSGILPLARLIPHNYQSPRR